MTLFLLDGAKQLLSSGLLHVANILFSVYLGNKTTDECGVYVVTMVVDVTLGVLICYGILSGINLILQAKKIRALKSGNYFRRIATEDGNSDYAIDYLVWTEQVAVWCFIVIFVGFG
jgi:STIMATE family